LTVICPKCGTPNRIPDSFETGKKYVCSKCKTPLPYPKQGAVEDDRGNIHAKAFTRKAKPPADKNVKNRAGTFFNSFIRLPIFHPVFFSLAPIISFYASNISQAAPSMLTVPIAITLGAVVLLLSLSWLMIRNIHKAAIIISVFAVLFFYYGFVLAALQGHSTGTLMPGWWAILAGIWGVIFISCTYFVVRTRRPLHNLTIGLNAISVLIFLLPTITTIVYELQVAPQDRDVVYRGNATVSALGDTDSLPDIYYIILDKYASESTLKEEYDFDNSDFLNYLTNKGFYVASQSNSNYLTTDSSLASSLNMTYVNFLEDQLGADFPDWDPIYRMTQNNKVDQLLQAKGYNLIHIGSWWGITMDDKHADMNFDYWHMPYFSTVFFEQTAAYPFLVKTGLFDDWNTRHFNCGNYAFDKLSEITSIKGPKFVFAHILLPHQPYVFNSDGTYLPAAEADKRTTEVNYVNQLLYTNSRVEAFINELIASSTTPPIIILQADEGPFPVGTGIDDPSFDWRIAPAKLLQEKMGILNAYYLPGKEENTLYPAITPVNSFRLIFNLYFKANMPLLPDRSYSYVGNRPYDFVDVTNKVSSGSTEGS
jgi:hypothetical protein